MSAPPRCPGCGARNPVAADWCTQCYRPLRRGEVDDAPTVDSSSTRRLDATAIAGDPEVPAASRSAHRSTPASTPVLPPADGLLPLPGEPASDGGEWSEPSTVRAGDGRFRDGHDGLEWRCDTCREWNPIEIVGCRVCSSPFMRGERTDGGAPRMVAPGLLLAATVLWPGAGHALLGLWGQAFFRGVLALVWGLGGLSLLLDALASGQPVLPAVPLLLGWIVLVGASANDVLVHGRVAAGRVLLTGRPLLWLVVGVIGATIGAAFVGALGAVTG